jgi:cytochrome c
MVSWVFGLERGKTTETGKRGLAGEVAAPKDGGLKIGILEASYTDAGRAEAPPLVGKASVQLRTRRIEAEGNETPSGCKILSGGGASGNKFLGSISHNHSAVFKNIPLRQVGGFTCRAASGGVGGKVELHLNAADGPLLGEFDVQPTGGWDKWVELKSPLTPAPADPARADVYAVFVNPDKGGIMNFDWLQFDPPKGK